MRKYMKYEIKGSYKFILGILAIVLIASTIIQLYISREVKTYDMIRDPNISVFRGFMLVLSILVIFGAFLTAFFYIIGSFRKELYEDRGYLTFTLPLTGAKILGTKLIVAIIWYMVLGISILLYNLLLASILHGTQWIEAIKRVIGLIEPRVISSVLISLGIVSVLSSLMTLILIYFSIALSRVSIRNKRIGGLWFVIFLVLNAVISYLVFRISDTFPYYLNLDNFKILHYYELNIIPSLNTGIGQMMVFGNNYEAHINIIGNLAQLLISIVAFLTTGYLIEKKIDL